MAMVSVQLGRQSSMQDSPRSPEAKLGMQVEDLWDVQEPELSPNDKLNACFERIEIKSDASLADVVQILAQNKILSALVVDVDALEDATWMDRYIGIVEFAGIAVRDISGSFRWAPFLALQNSNTFLTMLLLLSKYKMNSVPVLDLEDGKIDNIITQSAVVHMLAECTGLHWFESMGSKKLSEIGLPTMSTKEIITVSDCIHQVFISNDSRLFMAIAITRMNIGNMSSECPDGHCALSVIHR
ncbi:hypothetical protein F3Y22_tig00110413pilonHSYRG00029 [Hibiscus syriacus]|uniref:SNF1-related protein kinase regulatory subunit gamma-1 n=1 Tax=Hibiscus syriacus TaxID=106335 RepID=A0A6A3ASU9_HIBSY|nr:hypothetical protein F3Y22_tig00110413pilonHSYRG00029 [Hibiscus syriacus]